MFSAQPEINTFNNCIAKLVHCEDIKAFTWLYMNNDDLTCEEILEQTQNYRSSELFKNYPKEGSEEMIAIMDIINNNEVILKQYNNYIGMTTLLDATEMTIDKNSNTEMYHHIHEMVYKNGIRNYIWLYKNTNLCAQQTWEHTMTYMYHWSLSPEEYQPTKELFEEYPEEGSIEYQKIIDIINNDEIILKHYNSVIEEKDEKYEDVGDDDEFPPSCY